MCNVHDSWKNGKPDRADVGGEGPSHTWYEHTEISQLLLKVLFLTTSFCRQDKFLTK